MRRSMFLPLISLTFIVVAFGLLITLKSIEFNRPIKASINGRDGVVVSHTPGDLWVVINTDATPDEKRAKLREYMAKLDYVANEKFYNNNIEHLRSWVGDWRWNVEIREDNNGR